MKSAFGGNKLFTKILLGVFAVFLFAGTSFAATSIRLQQPGTPTNQDTFNITFVALDTSPSQPVSVQCYKKGPTDGGFSAFGSVINLSNGGNTDNCQVNSGVMNQGNGTYQFYAAVTAGSTTPTSSTVSVDFNNSTPGTPTNYNKTKPDDCTYKISFRSANDSGKTVKVVLYRSSDTNFSVDSSHQVNTLSISSDTDGSMTNNVSPNCGTEYFYVIRAFDVYGNGSGVVGDSNVTTTTVNPTTTTTPAGQGAIPVGGTGGGQVLGEGTKAAEKAVLGTESAKPSPSAAAKVSQNPVTQSANWVFTHKKISLLVLVVLGVIAFYLYRRFGKRVE
jgi:hypothetical protein